MSAREICVRKERAERPLKAPYRMPPARAAGAPAAERLRGPGEIAEAVNQIRPARTPLNDDEIMATSAYKIKGRTLLLIVAGTNLGLACEFRQTLLRAVGSGRAQ